MTGGKPHPEGNILADLIRHLLAVARGEEEHPQAAAWRVQAPELVQLERRLGAGRTPEQVLADAPASRAARQAAYLAALMTHGGDRRAAAEAAGVVPETALSWRVEPGWQRAEEAVRTVACATPLTPRVAGRDVPLTDGEKDAFLAALRQALPVKQAAQAASRSVHAFRRLRASDPRFATAWEEAQVLKGRPARTAVVDNEENLRALFAQGTPIADMAEQLGVAPSTVMYRVRRLGLKRPRIKRRKRAPGDQADGIV